LFGPLTVRPELWNRGVGRRLLAATLPLFDAAGVRHAGLFTFADSPKHLALYQRFDFWPRSLTAVMAAPSSGPACKYTRWSRLSADDRPRFLAAARALTEAVHAGLEVSSEIASVAAQDIGDVVAVPAADAPGAIAICHCGAGSEAGGDVCYLKFAAVRPGPAAERHFEALLDACAALARERRLGRLVAGVNTARRAAYRRLIARGFRTQILGVSMHRADDPIYDRADVLVLDDWR
jgi:GNAT superfamily N-acetyltransferase